jgi:vitamin B12 transporter
MAPCLLLLRKPVLIGLPLCALAAHGHALAQDPREEIVVTGRGLADSPATPAYAVTDLDRDAITRTASGRIEDVLSTVAGFQQFRRSDSRSANPTAQGVTLRALGGNATSRALVLLDGVPMLDPFFGHVPLSAIAPERLAAVRVTRGGGSGAFGAGAVAGTIELTSADARTLGRASGALLASQRGETEMSAMIAPELGAGFAVMGGRWERGQGFHTAPRSQRVPASTRAGYESWSLSFRAVAPIGDSLEVQARALVFDDHRTLRFAGADNSSSGQDASLRLVGRGPWQFDMLAYVQARDFSNVIISAATFRKTLDQHKTPSTGLGGKVELRPPVGGGHVLRLGGDLRIASGELQEEPWAAGAITAYRRAGGRNSDLGIYAEDDWAIGPLVLTAGLRADRWTIRGGHFRETDALGAVTRDNRFAARAGWATSFRGGAVWNAGGGFALRAAGYSGLRLPSLNELYRPFVVFPVTTRANAALRNERLRGYEVGIDFRAGDDLSLSLTAYDNRVRHAIANVTLGSNLRERRNVDAIRARGLELAAGLRLGQVSLDGSLALTDAEVQGSGASAPLDGMRPAQTPRIAASGRLTWRPATDWLVSASVRRTGAQFEDDLETDRLPAATTLDVYGEVPLSRGAAIVLRGENLLGETIITRKQGESIDLGAPRTIWAGIRLAM